MPIASLLFASTLWGIVWYPYRLLGQAGMGGELAALVTNLFALIGTTLIFPRAWREFKQAPIALSILAISVGWGSLAYILSTLTGEIMRVLFLSYLTPLWAMLLARFILKEKITGTGYITVVLALCGAAVMLWNPASGLPMPSTKAEWLGLSAGVSFALANVMVRKTEGCGIAVKSLSVCSGIILMALIAISLRTGIAMKDLAIVHNAAPLVLFISVLLIAMSLAVNYGLSHAPATQANVILLSELVVAAVASYFLLGEVIGIKEWVGGGIIMAASLFSSHAPSSNEHR